MIQRLSSILLLMILLSACAQSPQVVFTTALPTLTATSTPAPMPTSTHLPTATPEPEDYTGIFLEGLGRAEDSCLPDKTGQCIGVYVYDLDKRQELVSINADTPFQVASAFKGSVLVYFLQNCKKYWDTSSPEWEFFFRDADHANDDWYRGDEYRQLLVEYFSKVSNWGTVENFAFEHRALVNGVIGPLDDRYFILEQVYKMVTRSNNYAAGSVLLFVHANCPVAGADRIEQRCGGPNAITEYNYWSDRFSHIEYTAGEPRRGLNSWDVIPSVDGNGQVTQMRMMTYGLRDDCATQTAPIPCSGNIPTPNVWTARDLFKFYTSLFYWNDEQARETAFSILEMDDPGASRGFLKNLARKMGAVAISKNGYFDLIFADGGILQQGGRSFVVVTLSYDAVDSVTTLYGQYNAAGDPVGDQPGLLQGLLEGHLP